MAKSWMNSPKDSKKKMRNTIDFQDGEVAHVLYEVGESETAGRVPITRSIHVNGQHPQNVVVYSTPIASVVAAQEARPLCASDFMKHLRILNAGPYDQRDNKTGR